jgi:hypothetical protein
MLGINIFTNIINDNIFIYLVNSLKVHRIYRCLSNACDRKMQLYE